MQLLNVEAGIIICVNKFKKQILNSHKYRSRAVTRHSKQTPFGCTTVPTTYLLSYQMSVVI